MERIETAHAVSASPAVDGFGGLGINSVFMRTLERLRFTVPTPIQLKGIPVAITGDDVIGIAQTGTGKTLGFGIPMLQRIWEGKQEMGLVLLPTRELALQVEAELRKLAGDLGLRTAILIGGEPVGKQIQQLRRRPNIIIATPGRLLDLMENKKVDVTKTTILVLDEADRMLDMGFAPQINRILDQVPGPDARQTMLFSATMPAGIVKIANQHMKMPVRVEVAPEGTTAELVEQELFIVRKEDKVGLLKDILNEQSGSVLVFTRTKHGAKKLALTLNKSGFPSTEIHANRSLVQRVKALEGFKKGKWRVMVATDIAARGIDVSGIELVVNFDLPDSSPDYVHRIGRTGRAGRKGRAISFATPDQRLDIRGIERVIRKSLPIKKHPKLSVDLPQVPVRQRGIGGGRRRSFPRRPRFARR